MPTASTALSVLGLAADLVGEVAGGVLILKDVLGAASRIISLAEQVDKNREDLRSLAERAKKMEASIGAIIADRELDDDVLRRLEGMNGVLSAIEMLFAGHVKRSRVRRAFGYMFTVRKEVERLRGEFDDRLKELEVAASLDTNIITRGNSRFIGEFRNIRHAEIDLLRRITPIDQNEYSYEINCHLASCEGTNHVLVVQDIVLSSRETAANVRRIQDHGKILEDMSLIQNRHPVIASLYGRNTGPGRNRFIVLKAGNVQRLLDLLSTEPSSVQDVSILGPIVAKLVDALCYLQKHGAAWNLWRGWELNLYLDENTEPQIGVLDDLCAMRDPDGHAFSDSLWLRDIIGQCTASLQTQENQLAHAQVGVSTAWHAQLFEPLVEAGYLLLRRENIVRRADIANLIPLSQRSQTYILPLDDSYTDCCPTCGDILLNLALDTGNWQGNIIRAQYQSWREDHDFIIVFCVENDGETVRHTETQFVIPRAAAEAVKEQLGIAANGGKTLHLRRSSGPGETSTESTGWLRAV